MNKYLFLLLPILLFSCRHTTENNNYLKPVGYTGTVILAPVYHARLKILTNGLPDNEYTSTYNRISIKYGFVRYQIGGCVVSQKLRDSAYIENQKVYKVLNKKFGKRWREKFDAELESAMNHPNN